MAVLWLGAGAAVFFVRLCPLQTESAEFAAGEKSSGDQFGQTWRDYRRSRTYLSGYHPETGYDAHERRNRETPVSGGDDGLLYHVGTPDQDADFCPAPSFAGRAGEKPGSDCTAFSDRAVCGDGAWLSGHRGYVLRSQTYQMFS